MTTKATPHHVAALKAAVSIGTVAALTPVVQDIVTDGYSDGVDGASDQLDGPDTTQPDGSGLAAKLASMAPFVLALIGTDQDPSDIADSIATDAAHTGTMDTYQANGITQFNVSDDDPCPICQDEIDNNPHDIGDDYPMYHTNCTCQVEPVHSEDEGRAMSRAIEETRRLINRDRAAMRGQKTQSKLEELFKQGHALQAPDGTYSNGIENAQDVKDAISTIGLNTKIPQKTVRLHILKHAKLFGVTPPAHWNQDGTIGTPVKKPNPFAKRTVSSAAVRAHAGSFEIRQAASGDGQTLSGLLVPFNTRTKIHDPWDGDFTERFAPSAFDNLISQNKLNPVCLVGHDRSSIPVGSVTGGTLTLRKTSDGLEFDVQLPNSPHGQSVAEAVRRGDLAEVSLSFSTPPDGSGERWAGDDRTVTSVSSFGEFSLLPPGFAAYPTTHVALRWGEVEDLISEVRAGKVLSKSNVARLHRAHTEIAAALDTAGQAICRPNGQPNLGAPGVSGKPDGSSTGPGTAPASAADGTGSRLRAAADALDASDAGRRRLRREADVFQATRVAK